MELKNVETVLSLSPAQENVVAWRTDVAFGQLTCELRGALDVAAFARAWEHVVERHQLLRALLANRHVSKPVLVVRREAKPRLVQEDWRHVSPAEREKRLTEFLEDERTRPFDTSVAPLLRLSLLRLDEDRWQFNCSYHQLILDAESAALLWREVLKLYDGFARGTVASLPPASRYEDFVSSLPQQDQAAAEAFFSERLADFNAGSDGDNTAGWLEEYQPRKQAWLEAGPRAALRALEGQGVALDTLLEGAWSLLLNCYRGESTLFIGVDVSARDTGSLGAFRHALPLRVTTEGRDSVLSWLKQLEQQKTELRRYNYCSLAHLYESGVIPPPVRAFKSEVRVFDHSGPTTVAGLEISQLSIRETTASPLTLTAQSSNDKLLLSLDYDANQFSIADVSRMLDHLRTLLTTIGSQPEQPLAHISILSDEELQQLLVEWNATFTAYPREHTIPQLFVEQVEQTPDAIALVFGNEQLTYRELNERANKLAHHLRDSGVGPDVPVATCLERSVETIVSLIAILKAGGAYVPLEANYPAERLELMLEDSGVGVLITNELLLDTLPANWRGRKVVCVDRDNDLISSRSSADINSTVTSDNLAYIMYTSGSTGVPKGISVTHRNVVRLVKNTNYFTFDRSQIFLQNAPIAFDASTFEIWGSLLNGARLVLMPAQTPTLEELGEAFRQYSITTVWLTAGLFHMMVDERPQELATLRQLLAGGDVVFVSHVRRAIDALKEGQFINCYGPTENTTFTCCCPLSSLPPEATSVSLGRPISNTQVYVVDQQLLPVPAGATGELYIGGEGLARGYNNRPDLTAERFVPDPFSGVPGSRLYRTGDLTRHMPDGQVDFIGRRDFQVKVRGFRIELEEVEAALGSHFSIRQCVVTTRNDGTDKRLVAYVVPENTETITAADMRSFLREKLPEYMVPTQFVTLDALPLTPNGKVDRRALSTFEVKTPGMSKDYLAPRTPVEELLVGIWTEVLDISRLGIRDNFFDLGGHSLHATQLASRVREVFQKAIPIRVLFESPTIEAMAAFIESERHASDKVPPPLERIDRNQPLPLSFAQQRLWFINQLEPESTAYNVPIALRITGALDVTALEHAFTDLIKRHETLRTTFVMKNGRPEQLLSPAGKFVLRTVDLSDLPASERVKAAQRATAAEAQVLFDLTNGPLLRTLLLKLSDEDHVLLLTMHHIVSDAWSMGLLARELTTIYEAHATGSPWQLPELPIQYVDFAHWQRQWLTGDVLEEQLAYWRKQLSGELPTLRLPAGAASGPAVGAGQNFRFSRTQTEALKSLSRNEGVTLFMILIAALDVVLCYYTGETDVVIGASVAGRTISEVEPLIGFFVNPLVLRSDLSGDPNFSELLGRVRELTLDAYAHQDVPFDKIVEELRPDRAAAHSPLFQVNFSLDNTPRETIELPGLTFRPFDVGYESTRFSLLMALSDSDEGLGATLQYDERLFDAETIARLADHYQLLLNHVVSEPQVRLSELADMFAHADRQREEARREEFKSARRRRLRDVKSKAVAQP